MEILVDQYGCSLGKTSERVVVKNKGQLIQEIPFFQLKEIVITSKGVTISTDVISECMQHGIPIHFMDFKGMPYANIIAPNLNGTVQSRRQQLLAYSDGRGLHLAKAFVTGKIRNQQNILKYFAKYRKGAERKSYEYLYEKNDEMELLLNKIEAIDGSSIDEVRGIMLNLEGRSAQAYWQGVNQILHGKIDFPGRLHEGAKDPGNSMLNYGYAILASKVLYAICLAGLDPYGGFLHVDRSGRLSLVYDLIEEFRQPVVDRVVISMVTKGLKIEMDEEGFLDAATRQILSQKINERLAATEKYEGRKHALKHIIVRQARRMAVSLRGEANYRPFVCGW
jgi:CRISPR-associated protein Cas1